MAQINLMDQLDAIVDTMLGRTEAERPHRTILTSTSPLLDVSKDNLHNNKTEFLAELALVEGVIRNLTEILSALERPAGSNVLENTLVNNIHLAIEMHAYRERERTYMKTASNLAVRNVEDTAFLGNTLILMDKMRSSFESRLVELREQEKRYWNVRSRPPNYYARTIALRLARLYANDKHELPTLGTSSEGDHPSTDYSRALEQVFELLGIKSKVRNAAQWAIGQLTEADIESRTQNRLNSSAMSGIRGALKDGS